MTTRSRLSRARDAEVEASPQACTTVCTRNLCQTGPPMDPDCAGCVNTICAADPFCCDNAWDSLCVLHVTTYCGQSCP